MRIRPADARRGRRPVGVHAAVRPRAVRGAGRAGAAVELVTSRFAYGDAPAPDGYAVRRAVLPPSAGRAGSRLRRAVKVLEHVPDMLCLPPLGRGRRRRPLPVADDAVAGRPAAAAPVPVVLTAHDLLPREPRPGQARAQRRLYERVDAVVVHSQYGRAQLRRPARRRSRRQGARDPPRRVRAPGRARARAARAARWRRCGAGGPVLRAAAPVQGHRDAAARRGGASTAPSCGSWPADDGRGAAARPAPACGSCRGSCPIPSSRRSFAAPTWSCCRTRGPSALTSLGVLATALAFGRAIVVSDVGGFPEVAATGAARLVAPDDPARCARR